MLELYVVTFNCGRKPVNPKTLGRCLFDGTPRDVNVPDILAISLQELAPIAESFLGGQYLKPYFGAVEDAVEFAVKRRGNNQEYLEHVITENEGMTALMIFAKTEYLEKIKWTQSAGVGVGEWFNMANKGAVSIRLGLPTKRFQEIYSITITAAHLAPHEANWKRRNEDWEQIARNTVFTGISKPKLSPTEETPLLADLVDEPFGPTGLFHRGNHLIVAGDLNYRSSDSKPDRKASKSWPEPTSPDAGNRAEGIFGHLFSGDQLSREMEAERTFHGLAERAVRFSPTYKYKLVGEDWHWAEHRFPSWCDRILYQRSLVDGPQLQGQVYLALDCQPTSDHRPVAMSFRVDEAPFGSRAAVVEGPFPLNSKWEARRAAARRMELVVGCAAWLALTKQGRFCLVVAACVVAAGLGVVSWIQSV